MFCWPQLSPHWVWMRLSPPHSRSDPPRCTTSHFRTPTELTIRCATLEASLVTIPTVFFCGSQSGIFVKKCVGCFTNTQSRFVTVVLNGVLRPPHLSCHFWECPCISKVPEAMHEVKCPWKVSAQKALQGPNLTDFGIHHGLESCAASQWFEI